MSDPSVGGPQDVGPVPPDEDAMAEASDAELAASIAGLHREALRAVVDRHGASVHAVAKRVLRDDGLAGAVAVEVFSDLWSHPEEFSADRGSLPTLLLVRTHGRAADAVSGRHAIPAPINGDAGVHAVETLDGLWGRVARAIGEPGDEHEAETEEEGATPERSTDTAATGTEAPGQAPVAEEPPPPPARSVAAEGEPETGGPETGEGEAEAEAVDGGAEPGEAGGAAGEGGETAEPETGESGGPEAAEAEAGSPGEQEAGSSRTEAVTEPATSAGGSGGDEGRGVATPVGGPTVAEVLALASLGEEHRRSMKDLLLPAASVAAAVIVIVALTVRISRLDHQVSQLSGDVSAAKAAMTSSQRMTSALAGALTTPVSYTVTLGPRHPGSANGPTAHLVVLQGGQGFLTGADLPVVSSHYRYELWAVRGTSKVPVAFFGPHPDIAAFTVPANAKPTGFVISLERATGPPARQSLISIEGAVPPPPSPSPSSSSTTSTSTTSTS